MKRSSSTMDAGIGSARALRDYLFERGTEGRSRSKIIYLTQRKGRGVGGRRGGKVWRTQHSEARTGVQE
jgi:hypothetical protein